MKERRVKALPGLYNKAAICPHANSNVFLELPEEVIRNRLDLGIKVGVAGAAEGHQSRSKPDKSRLDKGKKPHEDDNVSQHVVELLVRCAPEGLEVDREGVGKPDLISKKPNASR
jgi:hypothetical protein